MATLTLGTVFEETKRKYQLKLLAGREGLHRSLRWLYFSEDVGNAEFLRGGELMVITGFGLQGHEALNDFVDMLIQKKCCGLILNIGKYITEDEIPQGILERCNEQNFPLITMPWKHHLADIIQEYSRRIFILTHEQDRLNDIFQLLLTDRKLCSAEDEARLQTNHFDPAGQYCVARISWCGKDAVSKTLPRDLHMLTENQLNQSRSLCATFLYQEQLVLLFHQMGEGDVYQEIQKILQRCQAAFPAISLTCGLGSPLAGIQRLREGYDRAGLSLICAREEGSGLRGFSQLGIYQLFYTCRDEAVLGQFSNILTPLDAYDAQYGSQLVETLRLYLRFSGRVNLVSDELYCHRNTTNYRMKKIKALLGVDLEERETTFQLQMAFYLRAYHALLDGKNNGSKQPADGAF